MWCHFIEWGTTSNLPKDEVMGEIWQLVSLARSGKPWPELLISAFPSHLPLTKHIRNQQALEHDHACRSRCYRGKTRNVCGQVDPDPRDPLLGILLCSQEPSTQSPAPHSTRQDDASCSATCLSLSRANFYPAYRL